MRDEQEVFSGTRQSSIPACGNKPVEAVRDAMRAPPVDVRRQGSTPLYCQSSAVRAVSSPVQQGRGIPRRRIRAAAVKGASALRFCMAFRFCRAPSDLSPYAERLQVFCACRFFVGVSARRVPFVGVSARRVRRGRVSPYPRCQPWASSSEGTPLR